MVIMPDFAHPVGTYTSIKMKLSYEGRGLKQKSTREKSGHPGKYRSREVAQCEDQGLSPNGGQRAEYSSIRNSSKHFAM